MLARTLIFAGVCMLASGVVAGPAFGAEKAESNRYAFLVGVNDYSTCEDDGLGNLSFCVADMKSFETKLSEIGFKRVYCLTTESTLSWQPTKAQIEQRLKNLLADKNMGPADFVLVALSGHGLERKGMGNTSTAYFCPADGHSEKVETLLPVMWFYQQLAESKAGMKMLVVDACRNPVTPRAGDVKPELSTEASGFMKSLADTAPPKGIVALLSCQSGQFSHEVPELGHGVFMHHVLEGLSGKADLTAGNRDGWVSLSELFNFAADQTEEYVATKCPVRYSAQTPILRGDLPNYKLVRLENMLRPEIPSEIALAFTVVEQSAGGEKVLEGAQVSILYRVDSTTPEVVVGVESTGSDGSCKVKLPYYVAMARQGEFAVSVTWGSVLKRFPLDKVADGRSWKLPMVIESPSQFKELTNSIGMKLRRLPAGEFLMGSEDSEEGRDVDEQQHRVRITRPFYLGLYEVKQSEYEKVMERNPSRFKQPELPVEQVTWEEAVEFCRRLSEKEGKEYRLPTEAEWEYACRAGTATPFAHGERLSSETDANFDGSSAYAGGKTGPYAQGTTAIGSYRPNPWGFYDMHGNVLEWCHDWYSESCEDSAGDDPKGPIEGTHRVIRGGSWRDPAAYCRSAERGRSGPDYRDGILGFRIAQTAVD